MFSVGIFTTHLPYVAMVAFYAYFLIFGVEKASKGEFTTERVLQRSEASENLPVVVKDVKNTCFYLNFYKEKATVFRELTQSVHLKYPDYNLPQIGQERFPFKKFLRPPPSC